MSSWSNWIRESLALTVSLVRQCFAALALLFGVTTAFTIWAEDAMQLAAQAHGEQRWELQVALGLADLVMSVVLIIILARSISRLRSPSPRAHLLQDPFASPYLGSFFAEYLRMLAQVLLYALLLILPGLYRYCQLIFVPFVALFSKQYRDGDLDALRAAERLVAGRLYQVFVALLLTTVTGASFEFLPQMVDALHGTAFRTLFYLASDLTSVWAFALLYLLFESAMSETRLEDL